MRIPVRTWKRSVSCGKRESSGTKAVGPRYNRDSDVFAQIDLSNYQLDRQTDHCLKLAAEAVGGEFCRSDSVGGKEKAAVFFEYLPFFL